jgi:hypothetical protein
MTPKEKAIELYNKMDNQRQIGPDAVKQCALIAVDEILIIMNEEYFSESQKIKYWREVKKEIEAL